MTSATGIMNDLPPGTGIMTALTCHRVPQKSAAVAITDDERTLARFNLSPAMGIGVAPRSGANLVEVNSGAIERMRELEQDFPEGMIWDIAWDGAEYVEVSIDNVQFDIFYGAFLAILVVLFRNRRTINVGDLDTLKG